jgi:SAM-dependent methyltransferase
MSLAYRVMYRLGFTPWEQEEPIADLVELVDGADALPPGTALDIGCGTGRNAAYCARRGWQVTGIDDIPLALDRARAHCRHTGQNVRLIRGDIAGHPVLGEGYSLLIDIGCLHGLNETQLTRAVANISRAAAPGATLLTFAIAKGAPRPGPVGIDPDEVPAIFRGWQPVSSRRADEIVMHGRLAAARPYVHRLVRTLSSVS